MIPPEVTCSIYQFNSDVSMFSWPMWQYVCRTKQIDARHILKEYSEHVHSSEAISDDYYVLMAWIKGQKINDELCGYLCLRLGKFLKELKPNRAIELIDLTMNVLAAANAPLYVHCVVRKKISEWLFSCDLHEIISVFMSVGKRSWLTHLMIHYYTPFDSPELVSQQMERFPVTKYIMCDGRQTSIPDLSKCAFPAIVTPIQVGAYLQLIMDQGHVDLEDIYKYLCALYCGNTFTTYSMNYHYLTDKGYCASLLLHTFKNEHTLKMCNRSFLYDGSKDYVGGNTACKYLIVTLLCGKRREELLNARHSVFDKVFKSENKLVSLVPIFMFYCPHNINWIYGGDVADVEMADSLSYDEFVRCPLMLDHIRLYWKHHDMFMADNDDYYELFVPISANYGIESARSSLELERDLTQKIIKSIFVRSF